MVPPSRHLRRLQIWGLLGSAIEPVFEARLTDSRILVRKQCLLAHCQTEVTRVRVGDYFAWILARGEIPPHEFVQGKRFGARYFDGAIER